MSDFSFDASEFIVRLLKYFLEGAAVATAAYLVPSKKLQWDEVDATVEPIAGLAIGSTVAGGFGTNIIR
eukprot:gene19680-26367_t